MNNYIYVLLQNKRFSKIEKKPIFQRKEIDFEHWFKRLNYQSADVNITCSLVLYKLRMLQL